jgi:hypothetical protein
VLGRREMIARQGSAFAALPTVIGRPGSDFIAARTEGAACAAL